MTQPSGSGPRWDLIAKVLGAGFIGLLASVTGYVVLVALGEPDRRRDADDDIRAILAAQAATDVQQAETDTRLAKLIEALRVDMESLSTTVDTLHPRAGSNDSR